MFDFSFFIILGIIIYAIYQVIKYKRYKLDYQQQVASTGFNPDFLLKEGLTRIPLFGIDANKRLFYLFGHKKDSGRIFHSSQVTNISVGPGNGNKWELTFTVIDLIEPKRYVYFGNRKEAEEWYGRVQAIWNSRP